MRLKNIFFICTIVIDELKIADIICLTLTERWPSGRRRSPAKGVWEKSHRGFESLFLRQSNHAPVAQLDRVSGYEPEGRRFNSFRAHQLNQ
jgi:hypothetical protein